MLYTGFIQGSHGNITPARRLFSQVNGWKREWLLQILLLRINVEGDTISLGVLENESSRNLGDKDGVVANAQGCSFRGSTLAGLAPPDHHADSEI